MELENSCPMNSCWKCSGKIATLYGLSGFFAMCFPFTALLIFSSFFNSKLRDKGYEAVVGWTPKKGIDVFTKDIIMIPVHGGNHWSLSCTMNAGYITAKYVLIQCKMIAKNVL
jgi:hypothetical protein